MKDVDVIICGIPTKIKRSNQLDQTTYLTKIETDCINEYLESTTADLIKVEENYLINLTDKNNLNHILVLFQDIDLNKFFDCNIEVL